MRRQTTADHDRHPSRSFRRRSHRAAHRRQSGRCDGRGQRPLWGRRQCRGPLGSARRSGRHPGVGDYLRLRSKQGEGRFRGSWASESEEHRRAGAHLPSRRHAARTDGSAHRSKREAFHRRAAIRQYERRPRAAVPLRRHHRGHHHGAVTVLRAARHRPQFELQGPVRRCAEVGRELAARCVLEGSVRRAGDCIRITAQLIDTTTGAIAGPSATTANPSMRWQYPTLRRPGSRRTSQAPCTSRSPAWRGTRPVRRSGPARSRSAAPPVEARRVR
jgi:hypothetical protein